MRRAKKTVIIVALILIAAGILLCGISLAATKFNFKEITDVKYDTKIHAITQDFSSINIDVNVADIAFIVSPDGESRVECYENDKHTYTVGIEGGALTIRDKRNFNVFNFISFSFSKPRVTLYLSRTEFDALTINTETSLVVVPQEFSFVKSTIVTDTGDVSYRATTSGELSIKATTGRIMVSGVSPASIKLKASTGSISLMDARVAGDVSIRTSTGRMHIEEIECQKLEMVSTTGDKGISDVNCQNLYVESSTGYVHLTNVIASNKLSIETDTGRVILDGCDAASIKIETDTGDVEGTLLSEKVFYAESDTGRIRVPHTASGGICEINTDTGDITIKIQQ